jgi:NAD(P)-dependent dehydrogenase (short-subunit alcohol dehydrogenase family)
MTNRRVALVSGANRGIGREVVRQLARKGLVAVLGARDPARGEAAAEEFRAQGLNVPVVALDVTDERSVAAAVAEVRRRFARLDVLVNNAGIQLDSSGGRATSALTVATDVVTRTFDTNTLGALRLIQAVVPLMRAQRYGRIVNVSSGLGQLATMGGGYPAYRLSKAALNALTRIVAAELGAGNVKVNAMHPGWVKTDMGGASAPRSVEEGAETIVWLATLPDDGPTGLFFYDRKPVAW